MPTTTASRSIVYLAIELSATSWLVACRQSMNEKIKLHPMKAGDCKALLVLISDLRRKAIAECGVEAIVVSCFEAGRDGFWLHRLLSAHGVINHVVEPTSILVTSGARRAKTDRLDAQGLLRVLAATFTGDHDACRVVNVPSVAEEHAKRQHREREYLVQERVRFENRIAALLATQGVSKRPSLRSWETDLNVAQTGDGRSIVRRQGFWDNRRRELTEALVHQVCHIRLLHLDEASGVV